MKVRTPPPPFQTHLLSLSFQNWYFHPYDCPGFNLLLCSIFNINVNILHVISIHLIALAAAFCFIQQVVVTQVRLLLAIQLSLFTNSNVEMFEYLQVGFFDWSRPEMF